MIKVQTKAEVMAQIEELMARLEQMPEEDDFPPKTILLVEYSGKHKTAVRLVTKTESGRWLMPSRTENGRSEVSWTQLRDYLKRSPSKITVVRVVNVEDVTDRLIDDMDNL